MKESKVYRVLFVGVGSIGERHLRCFQETRRLKASICDIDASLLDDVSQRYDVDECHADFDTAIDANHDAVVIATPAHLHVPMAIKAAEGGTHLLIEKPLSTSLDGIDRLSELIRRQQLTAMVAYVLRAHPALAAMKRAIASGRFGKPVHLYATCGQHFPTYRPAYRDIYYAQRASGGGAIQDALTHVLNAAQWLIGPIDRIVADAAHQALDGVEVEDTVNVLARHGEVLAAYTLNQHQAPNEMTITVVCRTGTARFEYHSARWSWMTQPDSPWQSEDVSGFQRDSVFVGQAHCFLNAMDAGSTPLCTVEEALDTLRANLAALASTEDERKWVPVGEVK